MHIFFESLLRDLVEFQSLYMPLHEKMPVVYRVSHKILYLTAEAVHDNSTYARDI